MASIRARTLARRSLREAERRASGLSRSDTANATIDPLPDQHVGIESSSGRKINDFRCLATQRTVTRVSGKKNGWDIESRDPASGHLRFIEVKGRHADARDVIITKNEILASLNAPDAFILALVRVQAGFAREPVYVQRFFKRELGFAETAVVFNIDQLLQSAIASHPVIEAESE